MTGGCPAGYQDKHTQLQSLSLYCCAGAELRGRKVRRCVPYEIYIDNIIKNNIMTKLFISVLTKLRYKYYLNFPNTEISFFY